MRSDSRLLRFAGGVLRVITGLAPGLFAYEIVLAAERISDEALGNSLRR